MEYQRLAQILQTDLSCSPLLSCGFAFVVDAGITEYGTAIYGCFLNAVAACKLNGKLLVFAGDVPIASANPIYMLQVVPIIEGTKKLKGITYQDFCSLRDAIQTATTPDSGLFFMADQSEMGDVLSVQEDIFPLRGNIELTDGKVTKILRFNPNSSFFEMACLEMYSGIPIEEDPACSLASF